MEVVLRYIFIAVIFYAVGMGIYKAVRTRMVDYSIWAIVILFGVVMWLSRSFLFTSKMYDLAVWIVCLLTIASGILPKESLIGRWIKGIVLSCLSLSVICFVALKIIATHMDCIEIETPLNGYSTTRIDEIYFSYNGKSFGRNFNLKGYSGGEDLLKGYNVKLSIVQIDKDIAKIMSLDLVPKHELTNRKGDKQ